MDKIVLVPIEKIVTNHYQKEEFRDEAKVQEIAESLKQNRDKGNKGLLQVTTVRPIEGGNYEQEFGRHRLYAFQQLAVVDPFWNEMPVIIRELNDQEMFEGMATEQLVRRDLSFIEEGDMYYTYMTVFGRNSVETAKRFGKTEEHVRGRIFLLQLPEAAKEQAKQGKINVSAARELVTVNKLLGEAGVKEALAEMETGIFDSPLEAIEQVLDESKETVRLDQRAGWFGAKKFPTKYLERLSENFLKKLLGIVAKDTNVEVMMDLTGLAAEPKQVTEQSFPYLHNYLLHRNGGQELDKLNVLFIPPACENCPLHGVLDGAHYCGLVICRDRKVKAWEKKELEDSAAKIGLPLYTREDGQAVDLNHRSTADNKLVKSRHADLRLMKANYMYNNFEGIGMNMKVVVVGKTAEKRATQQQAALEQGETEGLKRELQSQVHNLKTQFIDRFQWEVAAPAFASALDGLTSLPLMNFLLMSMIDCNRDANLPEGSDDEDELFTQAQKARKADGLRQLRRLLMVHTLHMKFVDTNSIKLYEVRKPVVEFARVCEKIADEWGIKLGKTWITQAEKYQAELNAALKELTVRKEKA